MSTWQQQDAQEYFSKVLDQVDKEVDWKAKRSMSETTGLGDISPFGIASASEATITTAAPPNGNPLEGLLAQRVGCTRCGYSDGLSMIPFNNLTVPLGDYSLYDMRDCLDEYSKLEYIEGVQCPKCTLLLAQGKYNKILSKQPPAALATDVRARLQIVEHALKEEDFTDATLIKKCNIPKRQWVSSTKSKQAVIGRAPKSFIVHVNRSKFNEYTGAQEKNNAAVQFPLFFNLDDWCLGKASDAKSSDANIESWSMDPNESMLADFKEQDNSQSLSNYELRAAVTHYGHHENGHYICYRKAAHFGSDTTSIDEDDPTEEPHEVAKEAWWRLSDEDVALVSEDDVLRQRGVFMLFYERNDGSKTPTQIFNSAQEAHANMPGSAQIEAAQVSLPDDSDAEFVSGDESTEKRPPLPPRRIHSQKVPSPASSPVNKQDAEKSASQNASEIDDGTLTDSTTENEDLFQSPAAITGSAAPSANGRIRMRTSSAFPTSGSNDEPLQSPIRMGTAF